MGIARAEASLDIRAPQAVVHTILADYKVAHPAILPKRAFLSLDVEQGGTGAGTVFRFEMRVFGAVREARAVVTEPIPGRVLVETIAELLLQTIFDVQPTEGGVACRATIRTEWPTRGLRGWIEGLLFPGYLRKLYAEELQNLARAAMSVAAGPAPPLSSRAIP
jgi:hypothetical protein